MSTPETITRTEWVVSTSPHVKDTETTARIMWSVVAALVPAGIWAVIVFGWAAFYVMALCVATCIATEALMLRLRGRPVTVRDGSAVVTGLLLAYILPSHSTVTYAQGAFVDLTWLKWQVPVLGSIVAIGVAKHAFGGLGSNIWNPALVGRAFVQIAFPQYVSLSQWPWPAPFTWIERGTDGVTKATALAKTATATGYTPAELFLGITPGSLGEISALLLLLGALYLIIRRYIDWRLPLGYLLALVIFATLFSWTPRAGMPQWVGQFAEGFAALRGGNLAGREFLSSWLNFSAMQIFAGGVMLGAFYMATDMVTSPLNSRGQFIFGLGCGFLTAVIRFFSGYPEGVCYAILLMNTVRPFVDRFTRQRVIGQPR